MKMKVFLKISVLKNFANFRGKHLLWETASNSIKTRLQYKCFPVRFLRTPFSKEQLRWLLFKISNHLKKLFKNVSVIPLTHNQSLITCNSHSDKLI